VRTLHPFTLLAIAAGLPALAWILPAPAGGAVTAIIGAALATAAGPRRVLLPALITAAPLWLFLYILHDVPAMIGIGLRVTTMVVSFIWLVAVLPPARLVEAMVAAGWPATAAYLFAATLSAVPVLRQRAQRIVEAQRCRGLSPRGGPRARFAALRALALPLVLSALHEVDERALALETRGLGSGARRTPLAPPRDRPVEVVARWGLVMLCIVTIVARLAWHA
jgi:energy-coupling factor transport system permease protein